MLTKYELGRALAAEEDAKLDVMGVDEDAAESCQERVDGIRADIEAAGGWDDEVQRGYDAARADYAAERA